MPSQATEVPPVVLDNVYLYVIMRNDLASLNPGKACAQATHAANQCVHEIRKSSDPQLHAQLVAWEQASGAGFGTCIVLSANEREMRRLVDAFSLYKVHTGITHDPSYPLMDGDTLHLIPLDTCAFAFGKKDFLEPFLRHLPLMA